MLTLGGINSVGYAPFIVPQKVQLHHGTEDIWELLCDEVLTATVTLLPRQACVKRFCSFELSFINSHTDEHNKMSLFFEHSVLQSVSSSSLVGQRVQIVYNK